MRQDYIRDMADPVGRALYIEADAADPWDPKITRCFEHSPEVKAAWNELADTVRADGSGTYSGGADAAIAAHLSTVIPELTDEPDSYIQVTARELIFGTDVSAAEIAGLVAGNIVPDATLWAALDAARTSPDTLAAVRILARTHDDAIEEQHSVAWDDYPVERESDGQVLRVAAARYRPGNDAHPAHISVELTVPRQDDPAVSARLDVTRKVLDTDGNLQTEISIHNVAARHLQELSGPAACIQDNGYAVVIGMNLSAVPGHASPGTATSAAGASRPSLTAEQQALLPSLTRALEGCLPANEQHHARVLARAVAIEVPTAADAITAYDKVTLAEVVEHHEKRMETYTSAPIPEPAPAARSEKPEATVRAAGTITYEPAEAFGGYLTIELPMTVPAPRRHLLVAATTHHPDGAPDLGYHLDRVATRHLQNATGTAAVITHDGQQTHALVILPPPLSEHPPMYGQAPTYMDSERRALTPEQDAALPDIIDTIRAIVPTRLTPHLPDIAHLAAQQMTTQADLLLAYQRTSVPEILADYDNVAGPDPIPQELQHLVKTARLSFPQPAAEALTTPPTAMPTPPARTAAGTHASHGYER